MTRTRIATAALALLFGTASLGALGGCDRGDAIAHERTAREAPAEHATRAEEPSHPVDGREALREGEALGKIDRLFSNPMGGTRLD